MPPMLVTADKTDVAARDMRSLRSTDIARRPKERREPSIEASIRGPVTAALQLTGRPLALDVASYL